MLCEVTVIMIFVLGPAKSNRLFLELTFNSLKAFLRYHAHSNAMDRWDNPIKNNPHWITSIYLKKGNITHTFTKFTFLLMKDLSKQSSPQQPNSCQHTQS